MALSLNQYKKIRTPFVFFDETGSINDQANRFFGLGMIKCMQPYFLDQKIRLHYILKKLEKKSFVGGIATRNFEVFEYRNKKGHHPIG